MTVKSHLIEKWFFILLGATLLVCVSEDIGSGVWRIHSGEIFPWRHMGFVPLYSPAGLVLEWIGLGLGGVLIAANIRQNPCIFQR